MNQTANLLREDFEYLTGDRRNSTKQFSSVHTSEEVNMFMKSQNSFQLDRLMIGKQIDVGAQPLLIPRPLYEKKSTRKHSERQETPKLPEIKPSKNSIISLSGVRDVDGNTLNNDMRGTEALNRTQQTLKNEEKLRQNNNSYIQQLKKQNNNNANMKVEEHLRIVETNQIKQFQGKKLLEKPQQDKQSMSSYKKFLLEKKNQLNNELQKTTKRIEEEFQKLAAREEALFRFNNGGSPTNKGRRNVESLPPNKDIIIQKPAAKEDIRFKPENSRQLDEQDKSQKLLYEGATKLERIQLAPTRTMSKAFTASQKEKENENVNSIYKLDQYNIGPTLGSGSYAIVKLAVDKQTNSKVAIKIYEKYKLFDPQKKKNVAREIAIMQKLEHPNCIKMLSNIENHRSINVVMEYVGNLSLHGHLKAQTGRRLDEEVAKKVFKQLIQGLEYLHNRNICHRDVKLENILLDEDMNVKIIDFGFSIVVPPDKKLNIFCGTPSYMAPEIVAKKDYHGPPVDVWSAGILLYVMLAGHFPFKGTDDKNLYQKIQKGAYTIPPHVSPGASYMIKKTLNVNPVERITAAQILKDTWVTPININSQLQELRKYVLQQGE